MQLNKLTLPLLIMGLSGMVSGSALALQKDISVSTVVDTSVSITQSNGSALPDSVAMPFIVGTGLKSLSIPVVLYGTGTKFELQLGSAAQLTNDADSSLTIPLTVTLGTTAVTTTKAEVVGATLNLDALTHKTSPVNLVIKPTNPTAATHAGHYEGTVSLTVTSKA